MFWSIILPLQITACFWLAFIGVVWVLTRRRKRRRPYVALAFCASVLLFIPSLVGIAKTVDRYRFGVFHYADFDAVNDWRVERYLPETATDITVEKTRGGYRARYTISKHELETWLDDLWFQWRGRAKETREEAHKYEHSPPDLSRLGWPPLEDAVCYEGPRKENWAGFTIWYSETEGIAYEDAGYW